MKINTPICKQPVVAIDLEATGIEFGYHEITEISMILLDEYFNPIPNKYISILLKIEHPGRYKEETQNLTGISVEDLELFGLDWTDAYCELRNWIDSVSETRSIIPLAHNYDAFDQRFLREFFNRNSKDGQDRFSSIFSRLCIDLKHVVKTYNNLIDFHYKDHMNDKFEQYNLSYICKKLNIQHKNKHRSLYDAKVTAQAYKRVIELIIDLKENRYVG